MAQTARLGLALMAAAQAQKHVTHNDALLSIDALVQAVVAETDRLAPPAAPQEGDVGGREGDVGATTDRDAHVRGREGRGIVDAVPDHGDVAALLLPGAHELRFAFGPHLRCDVRDAELGGEGACGGLSVTGYHRYRDPVPKQHRNHASRPERGTVTERDEPSELAIDCNENRRF